MIESENCNLLEESCEVAGEADWVVDKQVVEVTFFNESNIVSLEVVSVVNCVNHSVKALAEGFVVVLETNNGAEEEGFPRLGVNGSVIDIDHRRGLAGGRIAIW